MEKKSKLIVIVEDEIKIARLIDVYLKSNGYKTVIFDKGKNALAFLHEVQADLMLVDVMMPEMSGIELIKEVRHFSEIPIIMVTAKTQENDKILGFEVGCDDYICKPFSLDELEMRIQAQFRRRDIYNAQIVSSMQSVEEGPFVLDFIERTLYKNSIEIHLTPTQFSIMQYFMLNVNKVFSREELIESVFNTDFYEGFDRTIDAHIKNLRLLIEEDRNKPRYIITVWGVGYKMEIA